VTIVGIMTPNPITIKPDSAVPDAQSLMRREKIRHLPVLGRADHPELIRNELSVGKLKIEKVMAGKVSTAQEDSRKAEDLAGDVLIEAVKPFVRGILDMRGV
jgi:CBS domain-containing protein